MNGENLELENLEQSGRRLQTTTRSSVAWNRTGEMGIGGVGVTSMPRWPWLACNNDLVQSISSRLTE